MELMFKLKDLKDMIEVSHLKIISRIYVKKFSYIQSHNFTMQGIEPISEEEFEGEGDEAVCVNCEAIDSWKKRDCYARKLIFNGNDETRQKALFNCKS